MPTDQEIPVIDLFAGPGGLGEGFSALRSASGQRVFRVQLSIEMDFWSHQTLLLRSFFRQFPDGSVPSAYYEYVRGEERWRCASATDLLDAFRVEGERARSEAWCEELRPEIANAVDERVEAALGPRRKRDHWVLIGGPPCQAYSLVGRARMLGSQGDRFYEDRRHTLYQEYLRILARHAPSVFVMENVKGLLSATSKSGDLVLERILHDLESPSGSGLRYRLLPLSPKPDDADEPATDRPNTVDFVVRCENHGIPQARHRLIIVGIRQDCLPCNFRFPRLTQVGKQITCSQAISDLPRLRSGLSREPDDRKRWRDVIVSATKEDWFRQLASNGQADVADRLSSIIERLSVPRADRGDRFIEGMFVPRFAHDWYSDERVGGTLNHETRSHRADDLHRYLYVSCFGRVRGRSPMLGDFPIELLPRHRNAARARASGIFNDRFRVQIAGKPATTITSHISKDGHANIHYDPTQCRSLTVREAARLQTFPDNYFFEGPRTEQYRQVGNAVPPLLAREIASIVADGLAAGWR